MTRSEKWNLVYNLVKTYYNENGNIFIPEKYVADGINLHSWILNQKKMYAEKRLNDEQIALLECLEIVWNKNDAKWEESFNLVKAYYDIHHNIDIDFKDRENKFLYDWLSHQRAFYAKNKLSEERIDKLDELGMIWNLSEQNWMDSFAEAYSYFEKNHHLAVPLDYTTDSGFKLGVWVANQRRTIMYSKSKIIDINSKRNLLNMIGMIWDKREYNWELRFEALKKYVEKNKNFNNLEEIDEIDGYNIMSIVDVEITKFRDYNNGKMTEREKKTEKKHIEKLVQINFPLTGKNDIVWNKYFRALQEYKKEFKSVFVPDKFVYRDLELGTWVSTQRTLKKNNKLSEEKIEKLENIGFAWVARDKKTEIYYNILNEYYNEHGNIDIKSREIIDDIAIGRWVNRKKDEYLGKGYSTLKDDDKERLDEFGIIWIRDDKNKFNNIEKKKLYEMKRILEEYKNQEFNSQNDVEKINQVFMKRL